VFKLAGHECECVCWWHVSRCCRWEPCRISHRGADVGTHIITNTHTHTHTIHTHTHTHT
jgi:hypothetical protein